MISLCSLCPLWLTVFIRLKTGIMIKARGSNKGKKGKNDKTFVFFFFFAFFASTSLIIC